MKNKKTPLLLLIIAVLVIVIVVLAVLLLKPKANENSGTGVTGEITDNWDSGIDHGSVDASEVQIPGFKEAKMNAGDSTLHLNIGNPKENDAGFYVTVELEDGTVLYESPLLEPGKGISELPLLENPEKGKYNAYVSYQIVSLDESHTPMNTARTQFTLYVE